MQYEEFLQVVQHGWSIPTNQTDKAKALAAKFKNLRRVLKAWQQQISSLANRIKNTKLNIILAFPMEVRTNIPVKIRGEKKNWKGKSVQGMISLRVNIRTCTANLHTCKKKFKSFFLLHIDLTS